MAYKIEQEEEFRKKVSAMLEILVKEPRDFEFLKNWIFSNEFHTNQVLNYMIRNELIEKNKNVYSILIKGRAVWQEMCS